MQWHGKICILYVFLPSEREISPNHAGIFLDFFHGFGSYVQGLPKTKRCNSVAVTVSVRFRFGFGVYVKQPLLSEYTSDIRKCVVNTLFSPALVVLLDSEISRLLS